MSDVAYQIYYNGGSQRAVRVRCVIHAGKDFLDNKIAVMAVMMFSLSRMDIPHANQLPTHSIRNLLLL